jgi:hypothetical protein
MLGKLSAGSVKAQKYNAVCMDSSGAHPFELALFFSEPSVLRVRGLTLRASLTSICFPKYLLGGKRVPSPSCLSEYSLPIGGVLGILTLHFRSAQASHHCFIIIILVRTKFTLPAIISVRRSKVSKCLLSPQFGHTLFCRSDTFLVYKALNVSARGK